MKIRIPTERTYYQSSPGEPDRLFCWIPRKELEEMVRNGAAGREILRNYPAGLEIEVSKDTLKEDGVDLGINPKCLRKAYALLREQGRLDKSGYVQASALEDYAKNIAEDRGRAGTDAAAMGMATPLPKPKMSDGAEPSVVFQQLAKKGGGS